MAAKLQCEICGGKLIGKPGGIFECENCGTEYSTEWAKAKIQEITGTVKVEGTVEVHGSVQVEGTANKNSLLKRTWISLQDEEWDKAKDLSEQILNIDPECGEGYLLLMLARMKRSGMDNITEPEFKWMESNDDEKRKAWRNAFRFSDEAMQEKLLQEEEKIHKRWLAAGVRAKELSKANGIIQMDNEALTALDSAGKVHVYAKNPNCWAKQLESWPPLRQLLLGWNCAVGLCWDGTVLFSSRFHKDVLSGSSGWRNIQRLAWNGNAILVGLKSNGTLCSVYDSKSNFGKDSFEYRAGGWNDVEEIVLSSLYKSHSGSGNSKVHYVIGIRADGSRVSTSPSGETSLYSNESRFVEHKELPLSDKGYEVVSVGWDANQSDYSKYRIGLNGCVWKNKENKIIKLPIPEGTRVVAVAGCESRDAAVPLAYLTEDGRVFIKESGKNELQDLGWKLFDELSSIDDERAVKVAEQMEKERKAAAERAEAERRAAEERVEAERKVAAERAEAERRAKIEAYSKEKTALQAELSTLKGLFSGGRRKQIEARLVAIEAELKKLG